MARSRHPDKHIELAVQYAEHLGWRVQLSHGHAWGHILCPEASRDGCSYAVWSTPKNPEGHARQLRRNIDCCAHVESTDEAISGEEDEQ
jgi:hypothetical protein